MAKECSRIIDLSDASTDSIFLFGARQTGKTTLLLNKFAGCRYYDLLENNVRRRLLTNPSQLREELLLAADGELVVIDEIQLVPELLDEVHWLITRKKMRFVLSGSSARKLKRKGVNPLGGRALLKRLFPLVSAEIDDFDLNRALHYGMLPPHYFSSQNMVWKRIEAYVDVYLKEEIKAEALVRNLSAFNHFLRAAALTSGEMVNYSNIAQDCGIDVKTVKEYFSILDETMIGYMVPSFRKVAKKRVTQAPRFYFFDVSIVNFLLGRRSMQPGTAEYGHAFEHLMIQEVVAYLSYSGHADALSYWHTYSGLEVDAVLGDGAVAIEFKAVAQVQPKHLKGLKAFSDEFPQARLVIVSLDSVARLVNNVEVRPAVEFLRLLWSGSIF